MAQARCRLHTGLLKYLDRSCLLLELTLVRISNICRGISCRHDCLAIARYVSRYETQSAKLFCCSNHIGLCNRMVKRHFKGGLVEKYFSFQNLFREGLWLSRVKKAFRFTRTSWDSCSRYTLWIKFMFRRNFSIAAAAACYAAQQEDEDSYFGFNTKDIESAIDDLRKLLMLNSSTNSKSSKSESVDGWMLEWESPSITIWSRPMKSGLTQYKVCGTYTDIPAIAFYFVQTDLLHRKLWDSSTDEAHILEVFPREEQPGETEVIYWRVNFPRLMAQRDYVFARRCLIDLEKNVLLILSKATDHPSKPEDRNCVRVTDYASKMVILPHSDYRKNGFDFVLTYHDDTKLKMPKYAVKQLVKTNLPNFLERVHSESASLTKMCEESFDGEGGPADSRVGALHSLICEAERRQTKDAEPSSSVSVVEPESIVTAVTQEEITEHITDEQRPPEENNHHLDKYSKLRKIPVHKITPPKYLPDLKQFVRTLFTERRFAPISFIQVHADDGCSKRGSLYRNHHSSYKKNNVYPSYPIQSSECSDLVDESYRKLGRNKTQKTEDVD